MRFRTYPPTTEPVEHAWFVVDATNLSLGRLAAQIAHILRGKHKPTFAPHLDTGDYVIVLNAGKITVTGNKLEEKFYSRHSQFPGGFRQTSLRDMLKTHPERVIENAVKGMLPHHPLTRPTLKKPHDSTRDAHP